MTPEQQAAPEQPDLRQRIAQALRDVARDCIKDAPHADCETIHPIQVSIHRHNGSMDVTGSVDALAEVAAAVLQPDLAELAALREQLAAVRRLHTHAKYMSIDICDECSIKRRTGPRPDDWERMAVVPWPCPTTRAAAPTT